MAEQSQESLELEITHQDGAWRESLILTSNGMLGVLNGGAVCTISLDKDERWQLIQASLQLDGMQLRKERRALWVDVHGRWWDSPWSCRRDDEWLADQAGSTVDRCRFEERWVLVEIDDSRSLE